MNQEETEAALRKLVGVTLDMARVLDYKTPNLEHVVNELESIHKTLCEPKADHTERASVSAGMTAEERWRLIDDHAQKPRAMGTLVSYGYETLRNMVVQSFKAIAMEARARALNEFLEFIDRSAEEFEPSVRTFVIDRLKETIRKEAL